MLAENLGRWHAVACFRPYHLRGHEPGSLGLSSLLIKWI